MPYELSEIKEIRKKFNLTQTQLANVSGVSQSLIAKIEAGRLDPTYSNANDDIKEAISKMKKSNISQMPVIEEHKSIGVVSEAIILESLLNKKGSKIKDIMEDSAPVVSKNTTVAAISNLLRFSPMVLVSDGGELKGIITKSDLLGKVYK